MNPDLTRLTQLLPRPAVPSDPPDWDAVEEALGTGLPNDYKELIATYGGGGLEQYMQLLEPRCPNWVFDMLRVTSEREEANDSLWEFTDKPEELEAEDNRLVCWATTDNGEYLYWLVRPGDNPDNRTIMINDETGDDWERYDMTVTQFLTAALAGEIQSEILWDDFPRPEHTFRPARDISPPA